MSRFAGCTRWVYNQGLAWNEERRTADPAFHLSYAKLCTELLVWKEQNPWLRETHSQVLQQSLKDLMDGFQKFFKIIVPQLKPIILFTTITSTIGTLQLFDEVKNITDGGPANTTLTISQYIYNLCFKYTPNFGYAAAIAFVVLVMIAILSAIQMKVGGDD